MANSTAKPPTISMIAAHDPDLVIGREGGTPWKLSEDLKHFKRTTKGFPVLMGRRTFEEIGEKPLPGRPCYVLTSKNYGRDDITVFHSVEEARRYFEHAGDTYDKVFVIGGGQIYRLFLPIADELIISEVHQRYHGDTYFPEYRDAIGQEWHEASSERQKYDGFTVKIYRRK